QRTGGASGGTPPRRTPGIPATTLTAAVRRSPSWMGCSTSATIPHPEANAMSIINEVPEAPRRPKTPDYSVEEVKALIERLMSELSREKVSGQLVLTLHARAGSVARID